MPTINTATTTTKTTIDKLASTNTRRWLLFSGTFGSSTIIQYIDDEGTAQDCPNGAITTSPTVFEWFAPTDLQIVTTGSPNFNVTVLSAKT